MKRIFLQFAILGFASSIICVGVTSASTGVGLMVEPPKPINAAQFVDEEGKIISFPEADNKWKIAFFGYTRCPDVCPMTMEKVGRVLRSIRKNAASRLDVVFITVDGARDTPLDLKSYLQNFGPDIRGLAGDARSTQKIQKQFGVITRKFQGKTAMAYTLQHSIFLYLLDPDNNLRYMFSAGSDTSDIVTHINNLLAPDHPA